MLPMSSPASIQGTITRITITERYTVERPEGRLPTSGRVGTATHGGQAVAAVR